MGRKPMRKGARSRSPALGSVRPKALEAICRELGIADRMLDVSVPEVVLQGAGVLPIVRELEAAGVPEHVRVHREAKRARLADPRERLAEACRGHRRVSFGLEQVAPIWQLPPQPSQRPKLLAAERVNRRDAVLQPADVQEPLAEIHLIPGERAKLADPQAV